MPFDADDDEGRETGDDGVGIFSVIGAKRREMRSGQGREGEACLPPLQKPVATSACFTRENLKIGFLILTTGQDLR